jgi:Dimerisation domain
MGNTEGQSEEKARSPQQVLMQVPQGMWAAQCIATAARLGIADALAQSQPQGSTAIAHTVGADGPALARLLRALASLGVLAEPLPRQYALTSVGELLRSGVPGSMRRDWLIAETDVPHWQAWSQLYEGVRSGRTVVLSCLACIFTSTTPHTRLISPISVARWAGPPSCVSARKLCSTPVRVL